MKPRAVTWMLIIAVLCAGSTSEAASHATALVSKGPHRARSTDVGLPKAIAQANDSLKQNRVEVVAPVIVPVQIARQSEPLLSGSAGVTMLALVVALSVYLRNVSANTQDSIETMLNNKSSVWPPGSSWAVKRLHMLSDTRQTIENITPLMFILATVTGLRVFVGTVPVPAVPVCLARSQLWRSLTENLRQIDAILLLALTAGIALMGLAHWRLKAREIPIRNEMYRSTGERALIRRNWWWGRGHE